MPTRFAWTSSSSSTESYPSESQREIRTKTFELHQSRLKLHLCPMARLPTPVETEEVREAHALVSRIFPPDYPTEDRYPSHTRGLASSREPSEGMT
jgi:hypothetical protein